MEIQKQGTGEINAYGILGSISWSTAYIYVCQCANAQQWRTRQFLKQKMGWEVTRLKFQETNNDAKLIGWTATLMKEMCSNFGQEWTPNMLENATCKIDRHLQKDNVHYLLPWHSVHLGYDNTYHQLEFRVFGNKDWELLCFDGKSKHYVLSNQKPSLIEVSDNGSKTINTNIVCNIYK